MDGAPIRRTGARRAALALLAAALLGVGIVAGFFGARLPALDTLAHFRAHAAIALLLCAVLLAAARLRLAGLAAATLAAGALATVLPFILPAAAPRGAVPGVPRYTLLQMNLRYDAPDRAAALRLIGQMRPDVVTVQEMTAEWQAAFATLKGRYPYQYYCAEPADAGDAAILSRRPFWPGDEGTCDVGGGFAARGIDFNGTMLVVGSQHLRWPWPGRQWRQLAALRPVLGGLGRPRLIAGDFNAAPWSAALAAYAAASGTRIVEGIGPTWLAQALPAALIGLAGLPIDNVLVSPDILVLGVRRTAPTSSDHLPLAVTFALPFARPPTPVMRTAEQASQFR